MTRKRFELDCAAEFFTDTLFPIRVVHRPHNNNTFNGRIPFLGSVPIIAATEISDTTTNGHVLS